MDGADISEKRAGPTRLGLRISLVLVFVLAALSVAVEPQDFAGRWVLDRGRSDNLEQAVDRALEMENFVTRMMARKRILKSAKIPETMAIALVGNGVLVTTELQSPPIVPLGGAPIIWMRPKGAPVKMRMTFVMSQLVETFETDFGTRTQYFSLSNDRKSLSVDVEVASARLGRKIAHRVWFTRSVQP